MSRRAPTSPKATRPAPAPSTAKAARTATAPASSAPSPAARARARRLYQALLRRYPDAHCSLRWSTPHELLVATILSAQATDDSVNAATPALFARFPSPAAFARATPEEIAPYIRTIGLWRAKARAVHETMATVDSCHGGEVPRTMEALLTLRGVARKTANVVLGNAFGLAAGVVVDTHVARLAQRMGLSTHTDPVRIERDLMALIPAKHWCMLSHLLIAHGRAVCRARGGTCADDALCRAFCSEANTSKAPAVKALPRTAHAWKAPPGRVRRRKARPGTRRSARAT